VRPLGMSDAILYQPLRLSGQSNGHTAGFSFCPVICRTANRAVRRTEDSRRTLGTTGGGKYVDGILADLISVGPHRLRVIDSTKWYRSSSA